MAVPWIPLESNPELFTSWSSKLGLDAERFAFHDVYGLDAELLAMVPQPCSAVLLLFPISAGYEQRRRAADEAWTARADDEGLLWFRQNIGNACGTIALLHALANSPARSAIAADSPLAQLFASAAALSDPAERAALLQSSGALASAHADVAAQGQTAAPQATDDVDTHFVAFVRAPNGELVELDGRRRGPMYRGRHIERQEDLLSVAGQWIQEHFIDQDKDSLNFGLIALTRAEGSE